MAMRHRRTIEPPAPLDPVAEWRRRRLLAAGFASDLAAHLAENCAIDLHAMLELIDRGCPPELAARILAPLDDATPTVLSRGAMSHAVRVDAAPASIAVPEATLAVDGRDAESLAWVEALSGSGRRREDAI